MILDDPNKKGILGEIAVSKELIRNGLSVFTCLGGSSKVDLVCIDRDYRMFKIQVKTTESSNDAVEVYSVKNCLNPKYNSVYSEDQIDLFAVYVIDKDIVFYVTAKEILRNGKSSKFRFSPAKNGQIKNVRFVSDYLDLEKALRDCTPYTPMPFGTGDDTVQTTTLNATVGESQSGK